MNEDLFWTMNNRYDQNESLSNQNCKDDGLFVL